VGEHRALSPAALHDHLHQPPPFGAGQRPELAHHPAAEDAVDPQLAGKPVQVAPQRGLVQFPGGAERRGDGRP
jgi:hypothetical protein